MRHCATCIATDTDSQQQVAEEGALKLKHLQVLGQPDKIGGLAIFTKPAIAASPSGQHQVTVHTVVNLVLCNSPIAVRC